jgi:hypothetical protein
MKTKKARLNQIIFTALFVTILVTANASVKGTEVVNVSGLENIVETRLTVEDWMLKGHHWETYSEAFVVEHAADPVLNVEDWMLDKNNWFSNFEIPVTDSEKKLEIENWMINGDYWK